MAETNTKEVIDKCRRALCSEQNCSATLKQAVEELIALALNLSTIIGANSSNSSKPPSTDPIPKRSLTKIKDRKRKPGGQNGHKGCCLKPFETPTEIKPIKIDPEKLPPGNYTSDGFESRQVIEIQTNINIIEYRAEVLVNERNERFVAEFPEGVTEPVQYGNSVKASAVNLSQSQLIPLARVQEHHADQYGLPISKGSISNWNLSAYNKLEPFDQWAQEQLIKSYLIHGDETGINIGGKLNWLHTICNPDVTLFFPDEKRGQEAMDRMGILPHFNGVIMHDHWKSYFAYDCVHCLCNAHHYRELEAAFEGNQEWAKKMQNLLIEMKNAVEKAGGCLEEKSANKFRKKYRKILRTADKECPRNLETKKQSKSRNLLERLRKFETETLRFLEDKHVPFTNNRAENDQRMTKVQQKVSGCFRSMIGAKIFCRIRSYILTCKKHDIGASEAMKLLFDGKFPEFMNL
jgi:transposase